MIAAHELRIGNWVGAAAGNNYQIDSLDNVGVGIGTYSYDDDSGIEHDYFYDSLHPIPLTPEILVGCGFVYVENIVHWANRDDDLSYYKIEMPNTGNSMEIFLDYSCSYFQGDAITSLHQLMNLYFALTGEELKISL